METLGFSNNSKKDEYVHTKEKVLDSLKDHFRPEFLNRLDDVIVFDILSEEVIRNIVDIKIKSIKERLLTKNIELEISPEALTYLAKEGYNPHYGARPLGRLIQNKILSPIASFMISKGIKKGEVVYVSKKDDLLVVEMKKRKVVSPIKRATSIAFSNA
jgi:ATP-dependent Clp protease ATP-binding subunit ClpA